MSVTYEVNGRAAIVTIDRPGRRNAIDLETANALRSAWTRFDTDDAVDVGILYGAGGTFCAGADLKAFDLEDHEDGYLGLTRRPVSKPTIAAIEGYAVAGGLELALWCDLRIAAKDAVFGCFERRFGVPLVDGGTQRLPRLVGDGLAMELILTGRPVAAEEAHAIGLVNMVTETGAVLDAALDWAKRIAAHPQETVRSDRMALLDGSGRSLSAGLAIERRRGRDVMEVARAGARRFATGEGRSGSQVGGSTSPDAGAAAEDLPWNRVDPRERPSATVGPSGRAGRAPREESIGVAVDERPGAHDTTEVALDLTEAADGEARVVSDAPVGAAGTSETGAGGAGWPGREGSDIDLSGLRGYFIAPVVETGRAVVILSDVEKGLSESVLTSADRLAELGIASLAVDLAEDRVGPDGAARLVSAAVETLRAGGFTTSGSVALVGFGSGGALALWIAGVEERVTAAVAFGPYSPWPEVGPGVGRSEASYLCHQSGDDRREGSPNPTLVEMELRDEGLDATFHVYPRTGTDFYDQGSDRYSDALAAVAWQRTELFLERHL